jgi:hypothetical protein
MLAAPLHNAMLGMTGPAMTAPVLPWRSDASHHRLWRTAIAHTPTGVARPSRPPTPVIAVFVFGSLDLRSILRLGEFWFARYISQTEASVFTFSLLLPPLETVSCIS